MRVLIITQYFYPESNFRSTELAVELVRRGHKVDALVGIPNYPKGKYYDGYGIFSKRHEVIDGVNVYRTFQTPRGKGGWRLPLNYLTFVISACIRVLFQFAWKNKYDAIIVYEPSPVFQAIPAVLLKKITGTPIYFWIMDLWPDVLHSAGIQSKFIYKFVEINVKWLYNNSYKLLVSSKRMADLVLAYGDYKNKLLYYPNWSEDMFRGIDSINDRINVVNGIKIPHGYRIMLIGNLGKSQGLDIIAAAINALKDEKEIKWCFVGDGSERKWLENYIEVNDLKDVAFVLGRLPYECMPLIHQAADALILGLKAGFPHLEATVPSRLQSYMSAGKPIIAMLGIGGAELIKEANCGVSVIPGDIEGLINVVKNEILSKKSDFKFKGLNGRKYYENNFTMNKCIDNMDNILKGNYSNNLIYDV